MAHLIPILGKFASVAAFDTKTHTVYVCEDTLSTTVKLENGGIGVANFTFCSAGIVKTALVVHGTKGSIELIDGTGVELKNEKGEVVDASPITSHQSSALSDVEGEMAAFYDAVRFGKNLGVSTEEAFHHLAFIVAALDSVQSEKVVRIEQV